MAPPLAPTRKLANIDIGSDLVGMARFELAASCSQSRRANQAAPHPVEPAEAYPVRPSGGGVRASAGVGHDKASAGGATATARKRYAAVCQPCRCAGVAQW